jgi:flavin-binding protein dodecin
LSVESISTITASSKLGWQDALEKGLERARRTLRGIREIEVVAERANVSDGQIDEFVVELKLIFELEN